MLWVCGSGSTICGKLCVGSGERKGGRGNNNIVQPILLPHTVLVLAMHHSMVDGGAGGRCAVVVFLLAAGCGNCFVWRKNGVTVVTVLTYLANNANRFFPAILNDVGSIDLCRN